MVYGVDVLPENDPCVAMIDGALEGLVQGMVPGKFLVEFFPFLRHIPPWFPGARSQRLFRKWQAAGSQLKNVPYARTQADIVSASVHVVGGHSFIHVHFPVEGQE